MDEKKQKRFYAAFLSVFIIVGLSLIIYGFVRLAIYRTARVVDATVVAAEYHPSDREMDVVFEYVDEGEPVTVRGHFTDIKSAHPPYYEGKQTQIRIDGRNRVATYGETDIIVTVGGFFFLAAGSGFMYALVLRRRTLFDMAYDYERSMVRPEDVDDASVRYEAHADELSKLPKYDFGRMTGEVKVTGSRIKNRFKSYTLPEHFFYLSVLAGIIAVFWVVLKMHAFAIFFGLLAFGFGGLFIKFLFDLYIKLLVKTGKFTERKLATVIVGVFDSEGSFQTGDKSRRHTVFKKFRVVASIDGKRYVGYVYGHVPPPMGCVLKVLVRKWGIKRFVLDKPQDDIS